MNSKNSVSENSEIFVDLARVICHGPENVMPLHRIGQFHDKFGREYTDWIFRSEFGPEISFLDITFFNLKDPKEAWSLIIGRNLTTAQKYEDLLNKFIKGGNTLAGHEVFRNGLPTFEDTSSGEIISPEARGLLSECLHSSEYHIKNERLLRWIDNAPKSNETHGNRTEVGDTSPDFIFVDTYKASTPENKEYLFEDVSEVPITEQWAKYIETLKALKAEFKDASGRPLSLVMATPVGARTGEDGKVFIPFAHVFFGLGIGGAAGEARADSFLRTLMLQLYRANGSTYGEIRGQQEAGNSFGHEVKHVITALSDRWTRPAADLFDVEIIAEPKTHDREEVGEKVGKIEIASQYAWLANELGVIPFKDLIADAGDLIRLWCMLDNWADIPITRHASGFWTLENFMQECLDLARRTMQPHVLKRESATSVTALESFRHIRQVLKEVQICQQLQVSSPDEAAFAKVICNDNRNVWLARVFTAILKNCVQHGDPLLPIQVELTHQTDEPRSIVVSIVNYKRRDIYQLAELLMERGLSQADAREAVAYLHAADSGISTLELEGGRFNSESVVRFCLRKLQGVVLKKSADKADPYFIKFSYESEGGDKR